MSSANLSIVLWGIVGFLMYSSSGAPAVSSKKAVAILHDDAVYETFKKELISNYGVKEDFAEQLKDNLKKAIMLELSEAQVRQGLDEEDDDDDETEAPTTTTLGPSPIDIVNGIYGILSGVGTLNPDRIFSTTVNFVPPSQRETAMALVASALGKQTRFPTPTTTKPTTTTPSTTTKDDYYDEDEDETTKSAVAATSAPVVAAATAAPAVVAVSGVTAASASALPKYTVQKTPGEVSPVVEVAQAAAVTSAPVAVGAAATPGQDDEADLEPNLSHLTNL